MKCNKCQNEYPSQDYFKVNGLCNSCYEQMSEDEKIQLEIDRRQFEERRRERMVLDYRVGFGKRFGAFLLDSIIIGFINMIILGATGLISEIQDLFASANTSDPQFWANFAVQTEAIMNDYLFTFIFVSFIGLFYMSLEIILGASVGKLILGLQITKENGVIADKGVLTTRFVVKNVSSILGLLAYIPVLGFVFSALSSITGFIIFIGFFLIFGEAKMCLHDRIAKTAVYHKNDIAYLEEHS